MNPNLFRYIWQHSRREQIAILVVVVASLPFYFASFDLPKRIINDAIQGRPFRDGATTTQAFRIEFGLPEILGGSRWLVTEGFSVDQLGLLWALSFAFLALVIINGAFKYHINLTKGILGERMLRRMRYEIFTLFLRFRPEDIRAVKPAEAATIIKDEVEPIGGFIGDAFIQPAFLGMQAMTALVFIMVQNIWLGLVALSVVLIQAFIIPALRKEQIRLARERQIASRKLSGRIGEIVETAPTLHALGSAGYTKAEIGNRLGGLFLIRVDLFRRKFAVKYLNNLLAQVTPFFFYAIGGYLALRGSLDIGQLVAVIAAYRDLPPPIKELIDWDQQRADVTVKYQQILAQFPTRLNDEEGASPKEVAQALASGAPIRLQSFQVADPRGGALLEPLTLDIARPSHVALVGGGGADMLAKALGRQISEARGKLAIGAVPLLGLPDEAGSLAMGYVGTEPHLVSGAIRDNVVAGLMRRPPPLAQESVDPVELRRRIEAVKSGNPPALPSGEWLDLERAGVDTPEELTRRVALLLGQLGMGEDVSRIGLVGRLDPVRDAAIVARIPEARRAVAQALAEPAMGRLVAQFDPNRFNRNATLGENLLFGRPSGERLQPRALGGDPYVRSILEAEALLHPLAGVGLRMAEGVIEIFADLPPGSPLFERFSFIQADDMQDYQRIVDQARQQGVTRLPPSLQARLIELAISYNEQRHRMSVLDEAFEARVVRARQSLRTYLPQTYAQDIEFYDIERPMPEASLRDNVLFGRISYGVANAEARVNELVRGALARLGLEPAILELGLGAEVGPAGRQLTPRQRSAVALARALLPRPDGLVLDGALTSFSPGEARTILGRIRGELTGRTLIATFDDLEHAGGFDRALVFDGPRLVEDTVPAPDDAAAPSARGRAEPALAK